MVFNSDLTEMSFEFKSCEFLRFNNHFRHMNPLLPLVMLGNGKASAQPVQKSMTVRM